MRGFSRGKEHKLSPPPLSDPTLELVRPTRLYCRRCSPRRGNRRTLLTQTFPRPRQVNDRQWNDQMQSARMEIQEKKKALELRELGGLQARGRHR
jgi:hypothetical protein